MKICVDLDRCAGLGMCEAFASELFEVGTDGKVRVLREAEEDLVEMAQQAAAGCPTEAISVAD